MRDVEGKHPIELFEDVAMHVVKMDVAAAGKSRVAPHMPCYPHSWRNCQTI